MKTSNSLVEIIHGRLYWVSDRNPPAKQRNVFILNTDETHPYVPYSSDFGPVHLGHTSSYCQQLDQLLNGSHRVIHYTSSAPSKRANSAYLMCAFQVLMLERSPEEAWRHFSGVPPFVDFCDAGDVFSTYKCTILHCLQGLQHAVSLGWFDPRAFDVQSYEHYSACENGDWNWVIPGEILAFPAPVNSPSESELTTWTADDYAKLFKQLGIRSVIRLNENTYDSSRFVRNGLRFSDLWFEDGSCPNNEIINEFVRIATHEGPIAVHCKAGLGRTGTLIAIYCMVRYGFTATNIIAWTRICRPGSVLGQQQQFLLDVEETLARHQMNGESTVFVEESKHPDLSKGVNGQADRLLMAKRGRTSNFIKNWRNRKAKTNIR